MAVLRQTSGGLNGIIRVAAYRGRPRSTFRCFAKAGSQRTTAVGDGFDDIKKVGQFIFIRHGEKTVDDDQTTLSVQGYVRATNLDKVFGRGKTAPGTYKTPDIIYAMNQKKLTSSRRPFDTVAPLAMKLGMDPVLGERTGDHGDGVFDAQINRDDHDKLRENIVKHAEDSYKGKTILTCWEHKAIPMIAHTLGLTATELNWGSKPSSGKDENTNFTAIWVFTPSLVDDPERYFRVYEMFDIEPNLCDEQGRCPLDDDPNVANKAYAIKPSQGPYNTLAS